MAPASSTRSTTGVYKIEDDDLDLVGTSEVPMAAYHSDEILDPDTLPRRYAAFSSCFRKEAGSAGKDTKGIIRVHRFDKVHMFVYTTLDHSFAEHRRLLEWEKAFLDKLELAYRVIDVAAGDLGLSAPAQVRPRGLDPHPGQVPRAHLGIQLHHLPGTSTRHPGADREWHHPPVATLNGTLTAITRAIVAVLETHQQADGSVRVPKALQKWLGREVLEPVPRQAEHDGEHHRPPGEFRLAAEARRARHRRHPAALDRRHRHDLRGALSPDKVRYVLAGPTTPAPTWCSPPVARPTR